MNEKDDSRLSDDEWKILEFLRAETAKEQEFYWARFSAFSALHAAIIVFYAASNSPRSITLTVFGIALSLVWIAVQCASRHYIWRVKQPFHKLREKAGIEYPRNDSIFNNGITAATRVGLLVPFAVALLWLFLALCK